MAICQLIGYFDGQIYCYDDESVKNKEGLDGKVCEVIGSEGKLLVKIIKENNLGSEFLDEWKLDWLDRFERVKALQFYSKKAGLGTRVAFPIDILVDETDVAYGLLLPRAEGIKWSKAATLPIDLKELTESCISLADTVSRLHSRGIYVGDWNPSNFLVHQGVTTLIDTDIFRVMHQNKVYPNPFHFPSHIPAEMRDPRWTAWKLTSEQDYWGVAILFYQILLNIHPFYCKTLEARNVEDAIDIGMQKKQLHFQIDVADNGTCSIYTQKYQRLFFSELPFDILTCFMVTFQSGFDDPSKRVTAQEWYRALKKVRFSTCRKGHSRFENAVRCPVCDV
jgi:DNA-binding helix-hairpin-helix protein with protein kinase domain